MSSTRSSRPTGSAQDRRRQAADAAAALRAQQVRQAARRRTLAVTAAVVFLGVVGVLVAVIVSNGQRGGATAEQLTPSVTGAHAGVVLDASGVMTPAADDPGSDGTAGTADDVAWPLSLAEPGGPVVVSVYLDFMCPWCGLFERANGATLASLVASGDVVLDWHPVAVNDRYSAGSAYPTRAAAAAFAVAQGDPENFVPFVGTLMSEEVQPAEGTAGLTNEELAAVAKGLGSPQDVLDRIVDGSYVGYVATATDVASQDLGQFGTPTILLDGVQLDKTLDWRVDGVLADAIRQAAAG